MSRRLLAEFTGTFWLVLGGCGSAVLASAQIGLLGVSFAFGLTVLTMAFALGGISGGHFNPAVTIGMFVGGRFKKEDVAPYVLSQILGGIAGAAVLYLIATGKQGFKLDGGLAVNGFGAHSPDGFTGAAGFLCETVLTFGFLIVILFSTDDRAPKALAPIAIGLALTLIHLVSIPVTNTSVNPARSTGPALLVGGWALHQLWLFWVAPILGAAAGGVMYRMLGRPAAATEGENKRAPSPMRWVAPALLSVVFIGVVSFALRTEPSAPPRGPADLSQLEKELDRTLGALSRTLDDVKDEATAKAALPKLETLRGKMDEIRADAARLPGEERATLDRRLQPHLGDFRDRIARARSIPGTSGQVDTVMADLLTRLSAPIEGPPEAEPAEVK